MGVSVMWSSKNIGSQEVTEIGGQYAYGCLEEGTVDKNLYKFYNEHTWAPSFPKTDFAGDSEYDVAAATTNGVWQMPTKAQWQELKDNCDMEWTTLEDVQGVMLVSKINGNSIFLPANIEKRGNFFCQYHTSENQGDQAYMMAFGKKYGYVTDNYQPWEALVIRPVLAENEEPQLESLTLSSETDQMFANTTMQINVTPTPADASWATGVWTSSDESVATVENGLVTAVGAGTAEIVLTCGEVSASITITVTVAEIETGDFVDLGVSVLWSSSYYGMGTSSTNAPTYLYAKMNNNQAGMSNYWYGFEDRMLPQAIWGDARYDVIAKNSNGSQRMPSKAESEELLSAVKVIKFVKDGVNGYLLTSKINGKSIFLPKQQSSSFYIGDCTDDRMSAYICKNKNDGFVVETTEPNLACPLMAVRLKDDAPALTGFVIAPTDASVYEENSVRLTFETSPLGADITGFAWSSSDESVAVVDEYGNVTGVSEGEAEITLSLGDAKSSVTVKVQKLPELAEGLVDMGLSVKWASCNLGAEKPWELGDRYQWGGLTPVDGEGNEADWLNPENKEISATEYDAIYESDNSLNMPTFKDYQELVNNCDRQWLRYHGVMGNLVTSRKNGASLFFPCIPDFRGFGSPQVMGGYYSGSKATVDRVNVCMVGNGTFYQVETGGYYALPLRGVENPIGAIYKSLCEKIAELQNSLDAAKNAIDSDYSDVADQFADDIKAIQDAIDALQAELDGKKDNGELTPETTVDTSAVQEAIEKLLADAKAAHDKKVANDAAYEELSAEIAELQAQLDAAKSIIESDYSDVADQFADDIKEIQDAIDALLADLKEKNANQELTAESTVDKSAVKEAIEELLADAKAAYDKKVANDAAYEKLSAEIAELQAQLDAAKNTIDSDYSDVADLFADDIKTIQDAIDALLVELNEKNANQELTAESTVDTSAVQEAIDKLLADAKTAHETVGIDVLRAIIGNDANAKIYTVSGKLVTSLVKGKINVVKFSDGTVRKFYVK